MASSSVSTTTLAGACAVAAVAGAAVGAIAVARARERPGAAKAAPTDAVTASDSEAGANTRATPQRQAPEAARSSELPYAYAATGESTPLAPHSPARKPARAERRPSMDSIADACRRVAAATSSDFAPFSRPVPQSEALTAAMVAHDGSPSAAGGRSLLGDASEDGGEPVRAVVPGLTAPPGVLKAAAAAAAQDAEASPATPRPIILGVGGASGSGKTSMNRILSASLPGLRVASISGDNYYIPLGEGVDPAAYNFDTPSAIDFRLLGDHLRLLRDGHGADIPLYDFATHSRLPETKRIEGVHVIIVDGIFTLAVPFIRDLCDFTIFTLEDMDVCLARRLKRDIAQRGRTVDDVLEQYERFVKPGYHMYVAPTMRHANLIVPRARENTETLAMLVEYIRHRVRVLHPELPELPAGGVSAAASGMRRPSLFDPDN